MGPRFSTTIYIVYRGHTGTTVAKTGEAFEVLAENELWSPDAAETPAASREEGPPSSRGVLYAAVAVDGGILMRTGERLFFVQE